MSMIKDAANALATLLAAEMDALTARLEALEQGVPPAEPLPPDPEPTPPDPEPTPVDPEPPNLETIAETSLEALPKGTDGPGVLAGKWWHYAGDIENMTAQARSDAPRSAPGVVEFLFPTGMVPGVAPGAFGGWQEEGGERVEYAEVLESGWFQVAGPDFETQKIGVKLLGYWGVGKHGISAIDNQVYGMMVGPGGNTAAMSEWALALFQQGQVSRRMNQNHNLATKVKAGQWHEYKVHFVLNDLGQANGQARLWLDGTLVLECTDVTWRTADAPSGFYGRRVGPVWGGKGGDAKTRDDRIYYDHVVLSGRRLPR